MKNIVYLLLFMVQLNTNAQNVEKRTTEIRKMYQNIVSQKQEYDTIQNDITWDIFDVYDYDPDIGSGNTVKAQMVHYYKNKTLKFITINISSYGDFDSRLRDIEYYYNNDSVFFIYIVNKYTVRFPPNPPTNIKIDEHRLYFSEDGNCIRYLIKEVEGKPEAIDSLRQVTPNVELDCIDAQELIMEAKKYSK